MGDLPVVFLLHQVIPRPEGHQVSVVGGGGDGDTACTPDVGVTQLIGQLLKLVCLETIIVPQHVIMRGSACAL